MGLVDEISRNWLLLFTSKLKSDGKLLMKLEKKWI